MNIKEVLIKIKNDFEDLLKKNLKIKANIEILEKEIFKKEEHEFSNPENSEYFFSFWLQALPLKLNETYQVLWDNKIFPCQVKSANIKNPLDTTSIVESLYIGNLFYDNAEQEDTKEPFLIFVQNTMSFFITPETTQYHDIYIYQEYNKLQTELIPDVVLNHIEDTTQHITNDDRNILDNTWNYELSGAYLPANQYWKDMAYGNNKYVAISGISSNIAYSETGRDWTMIDIDSDIEATSWTSIVYGANGFVIVGYDNLGSPHGRIKYSLDGVTWQDISNTSSIYNQAEANWLAVTYGDGKYVAVGYRETDNDTGTESTEGLCAYSTDGQNWTEVSLPENQYWNSITYGNETFIAISNNKAIYSTDGIEWKVSNLSNFHGKSITFGQDKFIVVGHNMTLYSEDAGQTWKTISSIPKGTWTSIAYSNTYEKFIAVSEQGKSMYSTDGLSWTEKNILNNAQWSAITYGNDEFLVISNKYEVIAHSSDGTFWFVNNYEIKQNNENITDILKLAILGNENYDYSDIYASINHNHDNTYAPMIQYSTNDVTAGSASIYPEGTLYVVIE